MTFDERLNAIAADLNTLTRIHLDTESEFRERFDRIGAHLEKVGAEIDKLKTMAQQDGENIRALARIAEIHEHRLEGQS